MPEFDVQNCEEAFHRLDDFLDQTLTEAEMACVKAHLEHCKHCAECFEFEASVIRCLREKLDCIEVPCDLATKVRAAIDRCCEEDRA